MPIFLGPHGNEGQIPPTVEGVSVQLPAVWPALPRLRDLWVTCRNWDSV